LAKPKRGGARRNLSNIINGRVQEWNNNSKHTVQPQINRVSGGQKLENSTPAAAVTSKLETGNFKATVRIICSSDTPMQSDQDTWKLLRTKHPDPPADSRVPCDPKGNAYFDPLQVTRENVMKALRSFPLGSAGGPDGLTAQHSTDLLSGATNDSFQQALVDFVNLLLAGSTDKEVRAIVFGGRLLALSKKGGGVRPITVGYTLRRLAAKCANNHVIEERGKALQPQQLGVGVASGAEAPSTQYAGW